METKRRILEKVIKRDGREVDYDNHKIAKAIGMAYTSVYGNLDKFGEDIGDLLRDIEVDIDCMGFDKMEVEAIQDVVSSWLYAYDKKVGNAYYDYREERSRVREQNTATFKKIMSIMRAENVVNSNANVDENSFGGKKFEASGSLFKKIALDVLLPKEISKAHKENRGYVHDLDSYAVGMHNCLNADVKKLLTEGFETRNGDVREANSIMTAMQLVAVIFQIQSQEMFGGVASMHLDYDLEEFVDKSFRKYIQEGYHFLEEVETKINNKITLEDEKTYKYVPDKVKNYAFEKLEKEGIQASQSLFHNLNTLESRPGSQVPFSSINFGRRESVRAKMICKWLLKASLDGIGKFHRTSIFPISIFQYKQGVNDVKGTPNYDIKKLAIESMCKRIYPNWVNGDWSNNVDDPNNPDTAMSTMGCRTLVGYDRNGFGYSKVGRGNASPYTINLVKLGIKHGICLGEREEADLVGFWNELEEMLDLAKDCLLTRYNHICSQSQKSAQFMYKNGTARGGNWNDESCIEDTMKHFSQAIGYIGIAEMCRALFGIDHSESEEVCDFAESVVKRIYDYCVEQSDKYGLNFGCYSTPAENLCYTVIKGNKEIKGLREEYGIIQDITDRDYVTNSHHVSVWKNVDIFRKLEIEARFTKYATAGCITYVELDSGIVNNPEAIEAIIDYAFKKLDIPYLAFNFPIDTCLNCGYQAEFNDNCTMCGSDNIEQLRRVNYNSPIIQVIV